MSEVTNNKTFRFSRRWYEYLKPRNNEAWLCTRCGNYNHFSVTECFFCGAEDV